MKRIIFDVLMIVLLFVTPWWVTLILAVAGLFIFSSYYEFLLFSTLIYVISANVNATDFWSSLFIYSSIILFYLLTQYLRRHIILYKNEIPYKS